MGDFLDGVVQEEIPCFLSNACVQKSEGLEVVPGAGSDPGVLWLVALGANEAGGIGRSESSNGPSVGEEGVVDLNRDKAMSQWLIQEGSGR